jgi:23S rRNA G2445 N2-methylase RlmL
MPQDNQDDLESKLSDLIPVIDWEKGLSVWKEVSSFERSSISEILTPGGDYRDVKPKFRATCYRSGSGHGFQSNEAAAMFGGLLDDKYKWPVSMKEFDLEVVLIIKGLSWTVCLTLTKDSLHRRNVVSLGATTLRATVCYNMLQLAEIQVGDVVCDPLAGSGAIIMESSVTFGPSIFNIAADNHNQAIKHCFNNWEAIEKNPSNGPIGILQIDSTRMPLRTACVDVFISDLPFGKRIGTKTMNSILYPKILAEMARVAKPSTARAVLLTQDHKNMKAALRATEIFKCWRTSRTVFLKLGGLVTHVYCLKRTAYSFSE